MTHSTEPHPIRDMREILHDAGRKTFIDENVFENCLCALVLAYEPGCKTYRLLEALPQGEDEMDELDVLNVMARLGYFARQLKISPAQMDMRLLPCLVQGKDGRPYVMVKERPEDGILPPYLKTIDDVENTETVLWVFQPYDENRKAVSKFMRNGTGHSWFRALIGRFRGTFAQILTASLILNIIALVTPLFIMIVYDRVIAANAPDTLWMLSIGVAIAIGFEWKLRTIRSRGLSWLAGRIDNLIGNKIFTHLLGLSPELIERASVSAQIARIKTFEAIRDFFSGAVFLSLLELPFVVIAAIVITALAGKLVLVPIVVAGLYLCIFLTVRHKIKTTIRLAAKATSARQSFMIESFERIDALRGLGLSKKWQSRFRVLSGQELFMHFRLNWLGMVAETCAHALTLMAGVATVGFGVSMIWSGSLSTGGLVATMILVWRVLTPFYSLCTMIPRLEQIRNSIEQVNNLMDIDTEAMEAKTASRLSNLKGRIDFSNVSLRYDEKGDTVFRDVNLSIHPGDFVVITGENGSGKTSMLKLIKSLYTANEGAVQIDGFDIRQLDAPNLRRQVGYVPQNPEFIDGTVIENLKLVNPLANTIEIEQALKRADAYDDLMAMPDKLETRIDKYGDAMLSASLKTRLSLARGYLHPSSILLIDELPNTLLSGIVGKNLKEFIMRNKGKRTCVMMSYRDDFMETADTIVLLQRGDVPVIGKYEDIMPRFYEKEAA